MGTVMLGWISMPGTMELVVIAGVLVLLFGAKKLPQLARGIGSSFSEFKKGLREVDGLKDDMTELQRNMTLERAPTEPRTWVRGLQMASVPEGDPLELWLREHGWRLKQSEMERGIERLLTPIGEDNKTRVAAQVQRMELELPQRSDLGLPPALPRATRARFYEPGETVPSSEELAELAEEARGVSADPRALGMVEAVLERAREVKEARDGSS